MVRRDLGADLVLCYEVGALAIPHVAARLIGDRGDVVQIAGRLNTRSDIAWTKLPDAAKCAEAECAVN